MKKVKLLIPVAAAMVVMFLTVSFLNNPESGSGNLVQGYVITSEGINYLAIGDVNGKVLFRSKDCSEVIQRALDRLGETGGGTLEIKQGKYVIQKKLVLPSNVNVVGSGRATVFLLGEKNTEGEGIIFFADQKDHIQLSGFTCIGTNGKNLSSAIVWNGCGFSVIRDVFAYDFSGYGFWIKGNSFANLLESNYTARNDKAGTMIGQTSGSRGGRFVPNNISNCISYAEDGVGFEFSGAICQNMVGCMVYLPKGDGIYMHNSTSNLISGCRVFMGFRNGITIETTHEMNISGNIVGWNNRQNLELNHCVWGTVTANEFIDAGGRKDPQYSIYMHRGTKSVQVTGNAIFNWHDNQVMKGGIFEEADCLENQISNNVINYYKEFDVRSLGKNSMTSSNLGLPHAYGSPNTPDVPNVRPEDIKLHLTNEESRVQAEALLDSLFKIQLTK